MPADKRPDAFHRTLDTLWRMESPRLLARIARITGSLDMAEELAQDVLLGALERWPRDGLPDNPAGWLMTVAKHRAIDHVRQRQLHARKRAEFGIELELHGADMQGDDAQRLADDDLGDDLLRLLFVACHPVLPMESRVALTLRLLWSIWSSTRATPRPAAMTGCARRSARKRCGLFGCWPDCCPTNPRHSVCLR